MDALVAWVRARLDEEEQAARAATAGPWLWGIPSPAYWRRTESGPASEDLLHGPNEVQVLMTSKAGAVSAADAVHIASWDPARVLAEVEAKRRILDLWDNAMEQYGADTAEEAVRALAQVHADHPDFKPEWRLT